MLSRPYRLTDRRDFATVYNRRRMAHTEHLTLYWMQDKRGHRRRFGFVTSKKVGKAHDRNLVRRRLRHICFDALESFLPGDYIVVARPGSPVLSAVQLEQQLFTAREKLYARIQKDVVTVSPANNGVEQQPHSPECIGASTIVRVEPDEIAPTGTAQPAHPVPIAIKLIRIYQMISRNTPSTCRYHPTCSEYMAQAMQRHGVWPGLWMGLKRIARCHPFAKGGHDPVP